MRRVAGRGARRVSVSAGSVARRTDGRSKGAGGGARAGVRAAVAGSGARDGSGGTLAGALVEVLGIHLSFLCVDGIGGKSGPPAFEPTLVEVVLVPT